MSKQKTLILIDGHALVHRAFHALPPLNTGGGELVNAVFGFTSILLKVLKDLAPDYIAATFDLAGPTFRHKEFEDYKATRVKAPDELYAQIARVKDVLGAFNIPVYEKEGFEADDVIGTIARQAKKDKVKTIIVTGDLDTLQLVDKDTEVFTLKKGVKDTVFYDEAAVRARFEGLGPEQMVDYKGLKGDPSDNIPGVPGVGEKTAIELLKQYGSLDELYKELENPKGKFSAKGGSASGGDISQVPKTAATMGISTIMKAQKIILLAGGENKKEIIQKALSGPVTPEVPASILQTHKNVVAIVDKAAAKDLKLRN